MYGLASRSFAFRIQAGRPWLGTGIGIVELPLPRIHGMDHPVASSFLNARSSRVPGRLGVQFSLVWLLEWGALARQSKPIRPCLALNTVHLGGGRRTSGALLGPSAALLGPSAALWGLPACLLAPLPDFRDARPVVPNAPRSAAPRPCLLLLLFALIRVSSSSPFLPPSHSGVAALFLPPPSAAARKTCLVADPVGPCLESRRRDLHFSPNVFCRLILLVRKLPRCSALSQLTRYYSLTARPRKNPLFFFPHSYYQLLLRSDQQRGTLVEAPASCPAPSSALPRRHFHPIFLLVPDRTPTANTAGGFLVLGCVFVARPRACLPGHAHVFGRRGTLNRPQGGRRLRSLPQRQDQVRLREWPRSMQKLCKGNARLLPPLGEHGSSSWPEPGSSRKRPSPSTRQSAGLRGRSL